MSCERIETRLIAYLDGKASAGDRREVEAHLAACAACRTRAEEFRRLWAVLEEVPAIEPSPAFDATLRQRIAAEPRPNIWSWIPAPRLAFAISLLLVLSVWIGNRAGDKSLSTVQTPAQHEEEFQMIQDLPVLEDYDVLANFEALSELPPAKKETSGKM